MDPNQEFTSKLGSSADSNPLTGVSRPGVHPSGQSRFVRSRVAFHGRYQPESNPAQSSIGRMGLRRLRYVYYRFIRLRGSSQAIARGLAAGVFAGWFPLFGLQIIIGIMLAALIRGNKIMAAAGTWVSNPFTYVPIYAFNFQVGQQVLGVGHEEFRLSGVQSWQDVMVLGTDLLTTLFLGCLIVGGVCAFITYGLGVWLVERGRRRRRARYLMK